MTSIIFINALLVILLAKFGKFTYFVSKSDYMQQNLDLKLLEEIPGRISDIQVLNLLKKKSINWSYVVFIKKYTNFKDDLISDWLNISEKTFRNYKTDENKVLKENTQEHVVLLLSLFKHGNEVFGSKDDFYNWLNKKNYFLDNDMPINYLKTISGIRLIEGRLTGIEYGDNV